MKRFCTTAVWCAVAVASSHAAAQTWTGGRTTPSLGELVAIDATGETPWPYGQEDIEGDGLGTFQPPEQSLDIRTAYATADASRFWCRVYASEENAVGGNVTVYIFVDTDRNDATGGSAAATEIDPSFTEDPSSGGYERVIGIRGNAMISGIWSFDAVQAQFVAVQFPPVQAEAESGSDLDPLRIGAADHGYVQANVDLALVDLTSSCDANLFVRSVNESASTTASDLNVGEAAACVPQDTNDNAIPDVLDNTECRDSRDCPAGGICIDGACVLAPPCVGDADCAADETCTDGRCVARPRGDCTTTADCGDLVCVSGQCVPCTQGGSCAAGQSCAPDGRCVPGTAAGGTGGSAGAGGGAGGPLDLLDEGEEVQGGACACGVVARPSAMWGLPAAIAVLAFVARRKRNH